MLPPPQSLNPNPPKTSIRDSIVIATKAAGPSGQMHWIRGGPHRLDAANIAAALDGSLRRLGTDYIDLYQLHWPDRWAFCCELGLGLGFGLAGGVGTWGDSSRRPQATTVNISDLS